MITNTISTETLVAELRLHADTDLAFAQRVALVCASLAERKEDPVAAIRVTFRIYQAVVQEEVLVTS